MNTILSTQKITTLAASTALLTFVLAGVAQAAEIPASCLTVKDNIASKIVNNGVPATDFKLDIVANSPTEPTAGKVVGHCGAGSYQIIYTRGKNINPEAATAANRNNEGVVVNSGVVNEMTANEVVKEVISQPAKAALENEPVSHVEINEPVMKENSDKNSANKSEPAAAMIIGSAKAE